ncbi:MAG: hypothetical protein ABSA11_03350 [Candidatus Bathyarchaeia archaeon]|jgi:hypothetical protein
MDKRLVLFLLSCVLVSSFLGYAAGYLALRPSVASLTSELSDSKSSLAAAQAEAAAKSLEAAKLNDTVAAQSAQIADISKQFADYRQTVSGGANSTISKLTAQLLNATETLRVVRSQLTAMETRNITLVANGSGLVKDSGLDVDTNRTLILSLGWTRAGGWSGYGFYTVVASKNVTSIGLEAGYVYLLEVMRFDNVTLVGSQLDARGFVYQSDRANLIIGGDVQVLCTPNSSGGDDVVVNWPSLDTSVSMSGVLAVNTGPP